MDRFAAMLLLFGLLLVSLILVVAFFAVAPVVCSCLVTLCYSLYLFMAHEESAFHHAQEFENRFWTIFAILVSTAILFCPDSPAYAYVAAWSPSIAFCTVLASGYGMHLWDRSMHRRSLMAAGIGGSTATTARSGTTTSGCGGVAVGGVVGRTTSGKNSGSPWMRRSQQGSCLTLQQSHSQGSASSSSSCSNQQAAASDGCGSTTGNNAGTGNNVASAAASASDGDRGHHQNEEEDVARVNACLRDIDQLLIPSTINNMIHHRFVLTKEREIITILQRCDARGLNYMIAHVQLGLLFYKIKDHRTLNGKHRTELIQLLAVERLPLLTVISRVIILHSLQLLKLRANARAEYWVRNILLHTHTDDLSELKTLTDAKGDYFSMNKLIYNDIQSETIRQDILRHIRKQAALQQQQQVQLQQQRQQHHVGRNNSNSNSNGHPKTSHHHHHHQWRKVLSDVDDTLSCSGGMYPAGVDKRYARKTVYPGVLAFYRELDLGTAGTAAEEDEEWQEDRVGNLVFLSARPHVYKDMSEKANFAKFQKLRAVRHDGRQGMHTMPSLLAGDLASGRDYVVHNDFKPLAAKKYENFCRYVSIYPEYQHVFVCDNGQGDVRAGELMFDSFPYEFEALYVHVVVDIASTYGYAPVRWRQKEFKPVFFRTYPEAALDAARRKPRPLIRLAGLRRICHDTVKDFAQITAWSSEKTKAARRDELNQAVWRANQYLEQQQLTAVELIHAEQVWAIGERVTTPYGTAVIRSFDSEWDMYEVDLDWRGLQVQVVELQREQQQPSSTRSANTANTLSRPKYHRSGASLPLETVKEEADEQQQPPQIQDEQRHEKDRVQQEIQQQAQAGGESTSQGGGESSSETGGQRVQPPSTPTKRQPEAEAIMITPEEQRRSPRQQQQQQQPAHKNCGGGTVVTARLRGCCISKFTPPTLPKVEKTRGSLFSSFLSPSAPSVPAEPETKKFNKGEKVQTPYGDAKVIHYRAKQRIVVVEMQGWKATAYLQDDQLTSSVSNNKSLLRSILRPFGGPPSEPPQTPAQLEFPHATGTVIQTPFGAGTVVRPIPATTTTPTSTTTTTTTTNPSRGRGGKNVEPVTSLGLSLNSWTLSDGSHPMLYCTVDSAKAWREQDEQKTSDTSILSAALGSLVTSSRNLLEPFLSPQPTKQQQAAKEEQLEEIVPTVERYYQDGAAVTTDYGKGVIVRFRPCDGFYEVNLISWTLANGLHPRAFLQKDDIRYRIADNCQEGYPVLTTYGLSGTLASVEPTTGVHIVTIPSCSMVCYLQPECIVKPLKAAVCEDVLTPYGEGRVERYDAGRDIYTIVLLQIPGGGTNRNYVRLHAKGHVFDRVENGGTQERDGPFGVNWLLRFLFPNNHQNNRPQQQQSRSRSNSVLSGSNRSLTT